MHAGDGQGGRSDQRGYGDPSVRPVCAVERSRGLLRFCTVGCVYCGRGDRFLLMHFPCVGGEYSYSAYEGSHMGI